MSTEIYIPLRIVLSHPGQFRFEAALNGSILDAVEEFSTTVTDQEVNWEHVESIMKPMLMCQFGARPTWRVVEIFDHDLCVTVGGQFRDWLLHWLDGHAYKYTHFTGD